VLCTRLELIFNFYTLVKIAMNKHFSNAPAHNMLLETSSREELLLFSCPSAVTGKKKKTQSNLWSKQNPQKKMQNTKNLWCPSCLLLRETTADEIDPGR